MKNNTTKEPSVLITGCSSGIGLACAKYLQQNGFHVIASARKPDDVSALTEQGFESIHLDLVDENSIIKAVAYINDKHPTLYGLVNNGAHAIPGAVEDLTREALRMQYETNVFGTHSLTQQLIPLFRQQDKARIVQISSVLGFVGLPMRGAYNSSKYALEGLTDTQRIELQDTNIKISIVQPGPIQSQFRANAYLYFKKYIKPENSVHKDSYALVEERLTRTEKTSFSLPSSAVAKQVCHALTSDKPKIRYRITLPTHVMAFAKRFLSNRLLDKFITKFGG